VHVMNTPTAFACTTMVDETGFALFKARKNTCEEILHGLGDKQTPHKLPGYQLIMNNHQCVAEGAAFNEYNATTLQTCAQSVCKEDGISVFAYSKDEQKCVPGIAANGTPKGLELLNEMNRI
jgi:hypothetical protein